MIIKRRKEKILIGLGVVLVILLGLYIGFTTYFSSHFYFRTAINSKPIGGKTVHQVEVLLQEEAKTYNIELKERNEINEIINGENIGFTYEIGDQVSQLKKKQNPFVWLFKVWKPKEFEVELEPSYDEALLKENFNTLACFLPINCVKPTDATIVFEKNQYKIKEGDKGTLVNKDKLYEVLKEALVEQQVTIDLEEEKCYEEARYTVKSKELINKRDILNRYISSQITYQFGDRKEVLDGKVIKEWVRLDEHNKVSLDEEAIKAYVKQLAVKYDTLYGTRQFVTTSGRTVSIAGGDYGWRINQEEESKALLNLLQVGNQETSREPIYEQEGWCRDSYDIGKSYVEINLTKQYLWLYIEGKLITEGSIVSGTGTNRYATPEGTYKIDYMQRNAILRGPGYATPVSFWMPFNLDIGMHDATWRSSFGGTIYMYSGSHGCINCSYQLAETIFNHVESGMPVVCYKETT